MRNSINGGSKKIFYFSVALKIKKEYLDTKDMIIQFCSSQCYVTFNADYINISTSNMFKIMNEVKSRKCNLSCPSTVVFNCFPIKDESHISPVQS